MKEWMLRLAIMIISFSVVTGQSLSPREIMARNDLQMTAQDEQSQFTMKLINKRGKVRQRQVVYYAMTDKEDNDKTLIRFLSPADVKGVGLLSVEEGDREDQWLYLPALKRVRRISSSEKSDSFMGSDFSYEDIEQNELDDYDYTFLREDNIEGFKCYVIQSQPVDVQLQKETAYRKTEIWIRQDNFVSIRVNFYDKKGGLIKVMKSSDIRPVTDDKWRAYVIQMENVKTGHHTELLYEKIQLNQGINEKYFTQRYLERGR